MAKIKNPPPKRVRLTKNLGNETRKFLNYLAFRMRTATTLFDYQELSRQCSDDMCALCANWNTWWDQEKTRSRAKSPTPPKVLPEHWRVNNET